MPLQPAASRDALRCLVARTSPAPDHARPAADLDALMRIIHFSDTHLGHWGLRKIDSEGHNIREQDVYRAFGAAIDQIVELKPDAVVHAGDFFDSWHPSTEALSVALDGLARLRKARI